MIDGRSAQPLAANCSSGGDVFSFRKTFLPSRSLTGILFKVSEPIGASLSEVWVLALFSLEAVTVRGRCGEGGELC